MKGIEYRNHINKNIQNIHYILSGGDVVETNKELIMELDKSKQETIDMAQSSIDSHMKLIETMNNLLLEHGDVIRDYTHYVASDVLDTYDKLVMLRTECIEKYINFFALVFQDNKEFDVSIPTKSLTEKKYADLIAWQDEIKPLKELLKVDENTSDEKADEVLENLKNI